MANREKPEITVQRLQGRATIVVGALGAVATIVAAWLTVSNPRNGAKETANTSPQAAASTELKTHTQSLTHISKANTIPWQESIETLDRALIPFYKRKLNTLPPRVLKIRFLRDLTLESDRLNIGFRAGVVVMRPGLFADEPDETLVILTLRPSYGRYLKTGTSFWVSHFIAAGRHKVYYDKQTNMYGREDSATCYSELNEGEARIDVACLEIRSDPLYPDLDSVRGKIGDPAIHDPILSDMMPDLETLVRSFKGVAYVELVGAIK